MGTKSLVLLGTESHLLFHSDRNQLIQQIQMIGGGALGQAAATTVRHVAAQNGVWSLGNFGGVPPKSAMMYHQPGASVVPGEATSDPNAAQQTPDGTVLPNKIEGPDYRYVFNSCTVGMVSSKPRVFVSVPFIVYFFSRCARQLHPWEGLSLIATSYFANYRTTPSKKFVP